MAHLPSISRVSEASSNIHTASPLLNRAHHTTPPEQTTARDLNSPPPNKRRRLDEPVIKTEELPSIIQPRSPTPRTRSPTTAVPRGTTPPPTPVHVKHEPRTPSPPPADPPRRTATSGSKRYFPVPPDCTRRNPEFQDNRRKWARRECVILRDLGLHIEKFFFRDDGMVIEWTSAEPVWFDTLRPVRARPRAPPPVTHEIIDVDEESSDAPSQPIAPPAPRPPSPSVSVISVPSSPIPVPSPPNPPGEDVDIPTQSEPLTPEEQQAQLQQLSLDFIQKYILMFDSDRSSLASAYSEDAIFSFRDNNFACPTHFTFQRARPAQSKSSSGNSMPKLPALQNYRFSPHGGMIELDFDTVALEPQLDAPAKVMLSVHGQLVDPDQRTIGIDQSFVLQRDERGAKGDDAWPLVAISHQMVVRDTPWVHWKGSLDGLIHRIDT
ncbi:hypothetical protein B0H11DRAFT_2251414 [Mycena galericulata]|nr:hypothetical protein B0H11DRAFT_2251414 [Mycena galericulata]